MKTKLKFWSKLSLILFTLLIFNSSCEKNYYDVYEGDGSNFLIKEYTITSNLWRWDAERGMYFCEVREPALQDYIYDAGAMIGYVFFGTYEVDETQVLLPYHTNGRNISCDYSFDLDRTIGFYFHWDDYARINPGDYNFRVVFIWN